MTASISILSNLAVSGALVLNSSVSAFPASPKVGTLVIKDNDLYAYLSISGGMETWYPLVRNATASYVHMQAVPALVWTVNHNLGTTNVWYQLQDSTGAIVSPASFVSTGLNSFQVTFSEACIGSVVVVGTTILDVPGVKATILDIGNGAVHIDSGGITINGQTVLTSGSFHIGNGTTNQITYGAGDRLDIVGGTNVTVGYDDALNKITINAIGGGSDVSAIVGDILPTTNSIQNIGSPTLRFKGIYVDEAHLSVNTLYLGTTPILGTNADTVNIHADVNQSISINTTGTGSTVLASSQSVVVSTSGINADVIIQATGAGAQVRFGSTSAIDFTAPENNIQGNATISGNESVGGNLTVTGNLVVNGATTTVNSATVTTKDNIIVVNSGQVGSGVSAGIAGLSVDRGDSPAYQMVFDETDDMFKVGMSGSLQTIASQTYVGTVAAPIVHNHTAASTTVAGFMSATDKTKLDGLSTVTLTSLGGVASASLATVATTVSYADLVNKPTLATLTGNIGIAQGGTGATTAVSALSALGGVASSTLGAASGVATLGSDSKLTAAQLPTTTFASLTSKPTTLAGYGITDGVNNVNVSGVNTGDETTATIKSKLSITTLSGVNTGDQTLSGLGGVATSTLGAVSGVATLGSDSKLTAAQLPAITFTSLTSKPTTLAGYGITDASAVNMTQNSQSANYTTVLGDSGNHILHPTADTTARTFTIAANASVAYPIGTALTFVNQHGAGVITIAINTDAMYLGGTGTTGNRTLAACSAATALKITATEWIISGNGLT